MEASASSDGDRRWRTAIWGTAALLLLLPLLAMQFTDEVNWSRFDFAIFGAMLGCACGAFEVAMRASSDTRYRAAVGVALCAAFILVWMNLAVGIIGDEEHPANLMFAGVVLVGVIGAAVARLQARAMARALVAMALAQALACVIAVLADWGRPVLPTVFFVALWLMSAQLFRKAAREKSAAGA
jgi:hypothetical protein